MAKRLTEKQKEEIAELFTSGINIENLSKQFSCTKLTISRNLKKHLGEIKYQEIILQIKADKKFDDINNKDNINLIANRNIADTKNNQIEKIIEQRNEEVLNVNSEFVEIAPLDLDIENASQKNMTSISISDIDFPKTVFMIVDKKVELEIKYLSDFPKWQYLSEDELKRKTIEIYSNLKIAKEICGKDQKVIKVPNTNIFKIVAPILISRGISRIVSSDKLISL